MLLDTIYNGCEARGLVVFLSRHLDYMRESRDQVSDGDLFPGLV